MDNVDVKQHMSDDFTVNKKFIINKYSKKVSICDNVDDFFNSTCLMSYHSYCVYYIAYFK